MELITENANRRILNLTDEESDALENSAALCDSTVEEFVKEVLAEAMYIVNSDDDCYDDGTDEELDTENDEEEDDLDIGDDDFIESPDESYKVSEIAKDSLCAVATVIANGLKK